MLLHVIETAGPVYSTCHSISGERPGQEVRHPLTLVYHFHHVDPAKLAGIKGLATGGRVKGGPIQIDPTGVVSPGGNCRLEIANVGVGIIESVGHREPGASMRG
jgi:hypothetical protein